MPYLESALSKESKNHILFQIWKMPKFQAFQHIQWIKWAKRLNFWVTEILCTFLETCMHGNYWELIDFLYICLVFEITGWSVLNLPPCTCMYIILGTYTKTHLPSRSKMRLFRPRGRWHLALLNRLHSIERQLTFYRM